MTYSRLALYYLPPEGPLADFGAAWLGWDVASGRAAAQPDLSGLAQITATPRKYGFHATLKPPFRVAEGATVEDVRAAVADLAASCAPATCSGLFLSTLGGFLALTPADEAEELARVASRCLRDLDLFRAPALPDELRRRRSAGLSERQDAMLRAWGYPFVLDEFRFHMTLSGRLSEDEVAIWRDRTAAHLPVLPRPFRLDGVALVGERGDGAFELIQRYALTG